MIAPAIARHRLDNGLRVLLLPDQRLPLVSVNLWYHVGSAHDPAKRSGLAHLFEHMLFQGSAHVAANEHFAHVQRVGGVANGSTWYDRTNYYETLPASHLELGLWLESDRMGFLLEALSEDSFENQRSVVINERRQSTDNQPYGKAGERLFELVYPPGHPYHRPVIGTMADLEAMELEDARAFFAQHYRPDNAVLTLAGSFDCEAALELVGKYFGELTSPEAQPIEIPTPPAAAEGQDEQLLDDVRLARLYLAFPVAPLGTDDWERAHLVAAMLSTGRASRLYRALVHEQQIAQSASAALLPTERAALLLVVVSVKPGESIEKVQEETWRLLDGLRCGRADETEIERCRSVLRTDDERSMQSLDRRADLTSMGETYFDDPEWGFGATERARLQEASGLQAWAAENLLRERSVTLRVLPSGATS